MNFDAPPGDVFEPFEPERTKPARPRDAYSARLDGPLLVVSRDASLPSVCMKCGSHRDIVRRVVTFSWTPRWARLLIFCALVGIVVMALTTKRAALAVPLCPSCNARWREARIALVVAVVVLVLVFGVLGIRSADQLGSLLPALGVLVVTFVVVMQSFVRPRTLQVRKIDDHVLALKGCFPGAAQEIAEGSERAT